ncbi:hypothetical protein DFH11DRAFT_1584235 [Phellopilus nigrolimitatus]|nr:hypothetical protein DFH11DRAFT_1584235 [Phellopilus nigrolimitatus]
MSIFNSEALQPLLSKLVNSLELFLAADPQLTLDHLFTVQIGALPTALHLLTAAAKNLLNRARKIDIEGEDEDFFVDIAGTGGDGKNTFNVSTTVAVVAAGAGARMCKVCYVPAEGRLPPSLFTGGYGMLYGKQ